MDLLWGGLEDGVPQSFLEALFTFHMSYNSLFLSFPQDTAYETQ